MLQNFRLHIFFSGDSQKIRFPKLHCFQTRVQVSITPRNRVRGLEIEKILRVEPNPKRRRIEGK
jgi:hypothetical protein